MTARREKQSWDELRSKLVVRVKSKGCRKLTQAELDGDWSQSIPCGCGSCDLDPRHPTSLQLLARDACGSQDIPKASDDVIWRLTSK
jgi:hypothetical protein